MSSFTGCSAWTSIDVCNHPHALTACTVIVQNKHTLEMWANAQRDGHPAMVPRWRLFGDFLGPAFPASRAQYVSDLRYKSTLEMSANAQRDGRPAEYRWRPLFNAAVWRTLTIQECRTVTPPWRETRWNYLGCPKLTKRSQPLVGRSSPYYGDM